MERMGKHEERSFRRVIMLTLPALLLGVFLPQVLDGVIATIAMALGGVLMIAAVATLLGIGRAGERDYKERSS
jgi:ABC-type nickel/cobalt efflux system permease component RcnA